MAGGKGHMIGGVVFSLIALHLVSHYFIAPKLMDMIIYISIALLFSLWPDVDIKSIGQKVFYTIFFITDCYLIFMDEYKFAAYFGLFIILPILAKHRGWTHSLWAMFLVPLPLLFLPLAIENNSGFSGIPFYLSAVTGYFSHLALDGKFNPLK